MHKSFLSLLSIAILLTTLTAKENNNTEVTQPSPKTNEANRSKSDLTQRQIDKQMEREKKYTKEQAFYQGDEYNLSAVEVNKESLSSIPELKPDYDFDMDDVYSDIQ